MEDHHALLCKGLLVSYTATATIHPSSVCPEYNQREVNALSSPVPLTSTPWPSLEDWTDLKLPLSVAFPRGSDAAEGSWQYQLVARLSRSDQPVSSWLMHPASHQKHYSCYSPSPLQDSHMIHASEPGPGVTVFACCTRSMQNKCLEVGCACWDAMFGNSKWRVFRGLHVYIMMVQVTEQHELIVMHACTYKSISERACAAQQLLKSLLSGESSEGC